MKKINKEFVKLMKNGASIDELINAASMIRVKLSGIQYWILMDKEEVKGILLNTGYNFFINTEWCDAFYNTSEVNGTLYLQFYDTADRRNTDHFDC